MNRKSLDLNGKGGTRTLDPGIMSANVPAYAGLEAFFLGVSQVLEVGGGTRRGMKRAYRLPHSRAVTTALFFRAFVRQNIAPLLALPIAS